MYSRLFIFLSLMALFFLPSPTIATFLTIALTQIFTKLNTCPRLSKDDLTLLSTQYQQCADKILKQDSCCFGLTFPEVIEQLALNDQPSISVDSCLNSLNYDQGILLTDLSGIAHYALGPILAKKWIKKALFQQFSLVLLLPIEHINELFGEKEPSLKALTRFWGVKTEVPAEHTLVIVTGHPEDRATPPEKAYRLRWLKTISESQANKLYISNRPVPDITYSQMFTLSLKPLYLTVHHLLGHPQQVSFSIEGKNVLQEALSALEQALFQEDGKGTIKTAHDWHDQVMSFMSDTPIQHRKINVPYTYPPLTLEKTIERINGAISQNNEQKGDSPSHDDTTLPLNTPEKWFSAAVTKKTATEQFGTYNIGGRLVVRNFVNGYLRALGAPKDYQYNAVLPLEPKAYQSISKIFKIFNEEYGQSATNEHQNFPLTLLSNIAKRERKSIKGKLPKEAENFLHQLKHSKKNTLNFGHFFSNSEAENLAYHSLQQEINILIDDNYFNNKISELFRHVLSGNIEENTSIISALAATMIGEPSRYILSFLVALCTIDLFEVEANKEANYWKRAFCHPNHKRTETDLASKMAMDVAHVLGGFFPMSHGNSYHQVSGSQPSHGMHWVDFKSHLILIHWLCKHFELDQAFSPNLSGEAVPTPKPTQPVLTDTFADVMHKGLGRACPFAFDRFVRRLSTFDNMLIPTLPLRDQVSNSIDSVQLYKKLKTLPLQKTCRVGLPNISAAKNEKLITEPFAASLLMGLSGKSLTCTTLKVDLFKSKLFETNGALSKDEQEQHIKNAMVCDPLFWQLKLAAAEILYWKLGRPIIAAEIIQGALKQYSQPHPAHEAATKASSLFRACLKTALTCLPAPENRKRDDWVCLLVSIKTLGIFNDLSNNYVQDCLAYMKSQYAKISDNADPMQNDEAFDRRVAETYLDRFEPAWRQAMARKENKKSDFQKGLEGAFRQKRGLF